jgi:hypothetical protein
MSEPKLQGRLERGDRRARAWLCGVRECQRHVKTDPGVATEF